LRNPPGVAQQHKAFFYECLTADPAGYGINDVPNPPYIDCAIAVPAVFITSIQRVYLSPVPPQDFTMPYFVYKVLPGKRLELVNQHDSYQDARGQAHDMRAALTAEDDYGVRVIFAKNPPEAERLIMTERPAQLTGED
jgi:hypothetical protein